MSTAIGIRELSKSFPGGRQSAPAVDRLSLDIAPGEMFFLLGPSGCGKTTLLRMIAGFIEPSAGAILFDGRDVTHTPPNRRNTGMVFQSYALWPHMSVEANVAFGLRMRKVRGPERLRRVADGIAAVQMSEYASRRPNQLSGGQQQRVALARALVVRPDVLLLDEPLSNLDARLRNELRHEIRRACKQSGITTVYVTHDQKEAMSIADRIAIMESGRVRQVGTPVELYRRPASAFVARFLGDVNLIPGHVERDGPDSLSIVRTPLGAMTNQNSNISGEVLCAIRPEMISIVLGTSSDSGSRFGGVVTATSFLGDHYEFLVKTGVSAIDPIMLVAESSLPRVPEVGESVTCRCDACWVIPVVD